MVPKQSLVIYGFFKNKVALYNGHTTPVQILREVSSHMTRNTPDKPVQIIAHTVYLALGSNLGDRHKHLSDALQYLRGVLSIERISSVYETEPVGYLDQPPFFNLVCQGTTNLSPLELLKFVKDTEVHLGRQPTFRNGPRMIDIDILLYGDLYIQEEQLTIPHPRMAERAFVLVPLVEIAPYAIEPTKKQTAQALLAAISQQGVRKVGPA
jgi:2-amino-4-hydroxy-6-hydroxymethyldihydropteridine diphosphokinase